MGQVNYWLVGVAFLLGLFLTFALTIRRVKREVPVRSSVGAAAAGTTKSPTAEAAESKEDSTQEPENDKEK
jgi:uncharacterized membrane protein ArfC